MNSTISLTIVLLLSFVLAQIPPEIKSTSALFPKDGSLAPDALEQWELTYTAKSYLPICGVSTEKEGSDYWSNGPECDAAMLSFNGTSGPSNVTAAIYDTSGSRYVFADSGGKGKVEDVIGVGVMRCLCFGVNHYTGRRLDICLLMGGRGEVVERSASFIGNVAVGMQAPQHPLRQSTIPTCDELAKQRSGTSSAGNPNTTSPPGTSDTSESGSSGILNTSQSAPTPASESKKGLTTEAIIGIAVGLPGAIVAVVTLVMLLRKHRTDRTTKYNQGDGNMGGGFPWHRNGQQQPMYSPAPAPPYSPAPVPHSYEMSGDPVRRGW